MPSQPKILTVHTHTSAHQADKQGLVLLALTLFIIFDHHIVQPNSPPPRHPLLCRLLVFFLFCCASFFFLSAVFNACAMDEEYAHFVRNTNMSLISPYLTSTRVDPFFFLCNHSPLLCCNHTRGVLYSGQRILHSTSCLSLL